MKEISYRISEDGRTVEGLYHDALNHHRHGVFQSVSRVSNVEYDQEAGGWTVTLLLTDRERKLPHTFRNRADALAAEVITINQLRKDDEI